MIDYFNVFPTTKVKYQVKEDNVENDWKSYIGNNLLNLKFLNCTNNLCPDNLNARRDDPTLPAGRGRFISESTQGHDSHK